MFYRSRFLAPIVLSAVVSAFGVNAFSDCTSAYDQHFALVKEIKSAVKAAKSGKPEPTHNVKEKVDAGAAGVAGSAALTSTILEDTALGAAATTAATIGIGGVLIYGGIDWYVHRHEMSIQDASDALKAARKAGTGEDAYRYSWYESLGDIVNAAKDNHEIKKLHPEFKNERTARQAIILQIEKLDSENAFCQDSREPAGKRRIKAIVLESLGATAKGQALKQKDKLEVEKRQAKLTADLAKLNLKVVDGKVVKIVPQAPVAANVSSPASDVTSPSDSGEGRVN